MLVQDALPGITEHEFDAGEVRLNYAEGPPNGPPLVLLHGLGRRWQVFLRQCMSRFSLACAIWLARAGQWRRLRPASVGLNFHCRVWANLYSLEIFRATTKRTCSPGLVVLRRLIRTPTIWRSMAPRSK